MSLRQNIKLTELLVSYSATIVEVLRTIDKNAMGISFVVGEKQQLIGVLTDGDIRRILIAGAKLDDLAGPLSNKSFKWLHEGTDDEIIREALRKSNFIPILNSDHVVVDIVSRESVNMVPKRRVCVVSGTRAEYGILKPVLRAIQASPFLELSIVVTGMHLLKKFGETYHQIEDDGFIIDAKVHCSSERADDPSATAASIGTAIVGLTDVLKQIRPHVLLVPCDRSEMLAAAIAGFYTHTCVAHLHGGERSRTFDDSARHAITKLAHIHFAVTKKSGERIFQMGEQKERIHVVGAPGLDSILNSPQMSKEELGDALDISLSNDFFLVVHHPVDFNLAAQNIDSILDAVLSFTDVQTVIIHPNNDSGGRAMISQIERRVSESNSNVYTFPSVPHRVYLGLLKHASVLVGNSSSGIIEAPSFGTPVVNVGSRQSGRERAAIVFNTPCSCEEIRNAINVARQAKTDHIDNPYGDGTAGKQIAALLEKVHIDPSFLRKQIRY